MGNAAKRRRSREDLVRLGPVDKASAAMDSKGQRSQFAKFVRIRQARHRQCAREAKERSISLAIEVADVDADVLSK
jgi:hypothetical protein